MSGPPYFEDLHVGAVFTDAPALTLTEGHAALHQAICGDRLRLALDRPLGEAVLGAGAPLAHPALVWDVAIGQSTVATGRVIANLFYRGLLLRRPVRLGDTLRTTTEVVAQREKSSTGRSSWSTVRIRSTASPVGRERFSRRATTSVVVRSVSPSRTGRRSSSPR